MNALLSKTILAAAGAAALALSSVPSIASAGEVWNRVENQQDRIAQGVHSGQITRGEYYRDDRTLDRINAQRAYDLRKNDGHLTPSEYRQLNRELNHSSDQIYWTKHNRADQPGV